MNVKQLLEQHRNLLLTKIVYEELLKWVESDFLSSDGMKAKNIMVTNDGLSVPEEIILSVVSSINSNLVHALDLEIAHIEAIKLGESNEQ